MGKTKAVQIIIWPFKFCYLNIRMWLSLLKNIFPHQQVREGEKFLVLRDIKMYLLIHWKAPSTDSIQCIIPKGTKLITFNDPVKFGRGFNCIALNSKEFVENSIPISILKNPKFAGYSIPFKYSDIGKTINRIS